MTRSAQEFERLEDKWVPEHGIGQGLWDEETHPGGAEEGVFDASLEEVLHLITWGYMAVYPEIFGAERGSNIAMTMDSARGGYFNGVPVKYPSDAWYTYYDETCRYRCQVFEYFYWALTSILGGQEFEGRLEQIEDEWRYNTRAKVQQGDPNVYYLMIHPRYDLPNQLPDGDYNAETFTIEKYP